MITITPSANTLINTQGVNRMQQNQNRFQQAGRQNFFQPFKAYRQGGNGPMVFDPEFDGKRLRKSAMRKTVDYNAAIIKMLEARVWQRDYRDHRSLQPDAMYIPDLLPPSSYEDNPINAVTTRFVKTATNKMRCPIFCMAWTPEGRRLVTGASSGEFTLWNGLTFNFETILQAHETPVRTMVWSHNELWMVTADHAGYVKYWQSNMNNVKMFMAHQEAIRGISFSPTDSKFASCSDDGTVKIWDFYRCQEERILRGHGADVKCIHWHPQKGLIISGSKDNQQPVKLWDPKTGASLATIHAHKSTVMDIKWNDNGNWFVTASRDHLLKLFDIRNLNNEVQVFRGHKKESSSVAWHPIHEGLFCSGGSDGAILFWHVGAEKEVGAIEQAHDSIVWTLAWHPMGHILCSGSNDHTSKFWTRNRPGDTMRDKYNLNTLPASMSGLEEQEIEDITSVIPGMGPEDKVEINGNNNNNNSNNNNNNPAPGFAPGTIPGLEDIDLMSEDKNKAQAKKVPYSKPIPKNFQAHWNDTGKLDDPDEDSKDGIDPIAILNHLIEQQPGVKLVKDLEPEALYIYGKVLKVEPGSSLAAIIAEGGEKLMKHLNSGAIKELRDVIPYYDDVEIVMDDIESDDDEGKERSSNLCQTPPVSGSGLTDGGMEWTGANGANTGGFNNNSSSNNNPDGLINFNNNHQQGASLMEGATVGVTGRESPTTIFTSGGSQQQSNSMIIPPLLFDKFRSNSQLQKDQHQQLQPPPPPPFQHTGSLSPRDDQRSNYNQQQQSTMDNRRHFYNDDNNDRNDWMDDDDKQDYDYDNDYQYNHYQDRDYRDYQQDRDYKDRDYKDRDYHDRDYKDRDRNYKDRGPNKYRGSGGGGGGGFRKRRGGGGGGSGGWHRQRPNRGMTH